MLGMGYPNLPIVTKSIFFHLNHLCLNVDGFFSFMLSIFWGKQMRVASNIGPVTYFDQLSSQIVRVSSVLKCEPLFILWKPASPQNSLVLRYLHAPSTISRFHWNFHDDRMCSVRALFFIIYTGGGGWETSAIEVSTSTQPFSDRRKKNKRMKARST